MSPPCTCRGEWAHHHAFGGTFPCEGPESCIQCQPVESREKTVVVEPRRERR